MKQLHFLKNTDLGMERHHVANVALWNGDIHQWAEKIKALPMVTETLPPAYFPIIPTDVCRNNKLGWAAQSDRKNTTCWHNAGKGGIF